METLVAGPVTVSPAKLAHIVYLTNNLQGMRAWYMEVLNAKVAIENTQLCFLAYDDEHHRVGIVSAPNGQKVAPQQNAPFHHCAFTYTDLSELFGTYLRLKSQDIVPFWCVNHGPTTSMYYRDPDGNRVELQVDNFTVEETDAFFASGAYAENPIGITFVPEEWIARFNAGEPLKQLTTRPSLPPGMSPYEVIQD